MRANIFLFLVCIIAPLGAAVGQNLYIEVIDGVNYRRLPEVKIELESERSKITLYTLADGSIGENIPSDQYDLTLSRQGYQTQFMSGVLIQPHELTTLSFRLQPEDAASTLSSPHQETITDMLPEPSAIPTTAFLGIGYQFLNINAFNLTFAYFLHSNFFAQIEYSRGQESYSSIFFADSRNKSISFNNLTIGAGANFLLLNSANNAFFIRPSIAVGMEAFQNDNYFAQEDVDIVMQALIKPEIKTGYLFDRFGLFLGINYMQWILGPMNQERYGLFNSETEQQLSWNHDLFYDRGGIGLTVGLNVFF